MAEQSLRFNPTPTISDNSPSQYGWISGPGAGRQALRHAPNICTDDRDMSFTSYEYYAARRQKIFIRWMLCSTSAAQRYAKNSSELGSSALQERLASGAVTHLRLHPQNTKQQADLAGGLA